MSPPPHSVPPEAIDLARRVLAEDGERDVTTALIGDSAAPCRATIVTGQTTIVVAGQGYADAVAEAAGCASTAWTHGDGSECGEAQELGTVSGSVAAVLRAERPLLNLLQRACGIATATRLFVRAVEGTRCRILHTRKTAPGLRALDVAAVVAGGGLEHRLGLDRVVMIKDNHWKAMRDPTVELSRACEAARSRGIASIQVEVEDATQVQLACSARATRLLIDNQSPERFGQLAELARSLATGIEIEATGGITLANVRAYAVAGADYISVGALTHSVAAADLRMEVEPG